MTPQKTTSKGVASGDVQGAPPPGPEQRALDVVIGRWMTIGYVIQADGSRGVDIAASDVYEWDAHHERSDDGVNWVPSMFVRLTRVD